MTKLINTVFMLMVLCDGFNLSLGENLQCTFLVRNYSRLGTWYSCRVYALDNSFNNMRIDGYTGTHNGNKNDKDVKAIWIHLTKTKYFPANLGLLFNLSSFVVQNAQIVEIKADDFRGMQNLESLSLNSNNLKSIPANAFSALTKLKYISLSANQIIYFGSGVFDQQPNLNVVDLVGNTCGNKYFDGAAAVYQMKQTIKTNCKNPFEDAFLNEKEALIKEKKALVKEKDALIMENNAVVKDRDALIMENNAVVKDRDALIKEKDSCMMENNAMKMELKKNTREINELNEKFETNCKIPIQTEDLKLNEINEMFKQLLKASQEHQLERNENINLRAELSSTKEQHDETIKIINEREQVMILDFTTKLFNCEVNQQNLTEHKCNTLIIHCEFLDTDGVYSCFTRDLIIYQKDMELITVSGTHLESNSNGDVTELLIVNSAMFNWSNDIHKSFPALKILGIQNAQLKQLTKGDFDSAFNLTVLVVNENDIKSLGDEVFHGTEEHLTGIDLNSNKIRKLSSGTFHGLNQLKVLSLKDNLITELPLGLFKDVVMLEILTLTGNKIKFLHGKLLKFNTRLITFAVDHNKLREIGEDILSYSMMLNDVHLEDNDCIDEGTNEQTTNDLIFVIKNCCKNPAEALNVHNCGNKGWEYLTLKDNSL